MVSSNIIHNRIVKIVGDLFMNGCVVYIDDLIIYGKTIDEFLDRLERVLTMNMISRISHRLMSTIFKLLTY